MSDTAPCRTLEENLGHAIGIYQTWAAIEGEDAARARAVKGMAHDWAIPCADLGFTPCAACGEAQDAETDRAIQAVQAARRANR